MSEIYITACGKKDGVGSQILSNTTEMQNYYFAILLFSMASVFIDGQELCQMPSWMLDTHSRIVGGQAAPFPIPWQVSIRYCNSGNCHFCGGTILDEQTILTAAHCLPDTRDEKYVEKWLKWLKWRPSFLPLRA